VTLKECKEDDRLQRFLYTSGNASNMTKDPTDTHEAVNNNNNFYLSVFDESPRGVEPKVNSRSYSGTESSSMVALSLAWLSTQNDLSG
jgi:hypothetical protein